MGPAILSKAYIVYGHRGFVSGVLNRLKLRKMRHRLWGAVLSGILLVSCGANSPKPEEPKSSILPAPPAEAPVLKKAQLGPQPDLNSVIVLEIPAESVQSFNLVGQAGARYLAQVTPLYSSSKTKNKKKKRLQAAATESTPNQPTNQTQTGQAATSQDPAAAPEASKPPQGFVATFFPVTAVPGKPGDFYTAESLKGIKEGRYQLPQPVAPPAGAAQAAEPESSDSSKSPELLATQTVDSKPPEEPATLPESLWPPVTQKGVEAFEVETASLPAEQNAQPVILEIKNLDAVPRTVKVVIRERKS
jgi:hypothetical protein